MRKPSESGAPTTEDFENAKKSQAAKKPAKQRLRWNGNSHEFSSCPTSKKRCDGLAYRLVINSALLLALTSVARP